MEGTDARNKQVHVCLQGQPSSQCLTVNGKDQKAYLSTPTKIKLHETDKTISYSTSQTFKAS